MTVRALAALLCGLLVFGATVTDVAAAGATVSGSVTAADGTPLQDITVTVSSSGYTEQVTTGVDGTYATGVLPVGDYTVSFAQVTGPEPRLPVQYWPKVWTNAQSSPVVVSAGGPSELTGIDAVMELGASVGGTVRDPEGNPLADTCVVAWVIDGDQERWLGNVVVEPDGEFLMRSLPPVQIRLGYEDCIMPVTWLPSSSSVVDLQPAAALSGVDGVLERGSSVAGTVRDDAGAPVPGICVTARSSSDADWGETVSTGPDGTYRLTPLRGDTYQVQARPCDDQPFLVATRDGVSVGSAVDLAGVDLVVERATTISGTVRDAAGDPVSEICVQVSDGGSVRGSDESAEDGTYLVMIEGGGDVSVQFVDCDDDPRLGGAVRDLRLDAREDRTGVDVVLVDAAPATVSGTVTNVRGEPLEGVCVVGYVAYERVQIARTGADGTFRLPPLGSGAWSVAYFSCPEEEGADEDPSVLDATTGVRWDPQWFGGAVLAFDDAGDEGPDPIAAGATILTLGNGDEAIADHCFGCGALDVEMVLAGSTVRAEVVAAALASKSVSASAVGAEATWSYSLSCRSPSATLRAAASSISPDSLVLDGVDSSVPQTCQVSAAVAGLVVAVSDEAVLGGQQLPPTGSDGAGPATDPSADGGVRPLAFVG